MEFEKKILDKKYHIEKLEIQKNKLNIKSTDDFIKKIKDKINEHKIAKFIASFNHYEHTKNINPENIVKEILDARIILFCFGSNLDKAEKLAFKPRNLAIVEFNDKYIISFLEAPKKELNETIRNWVFEVIKND